MTPLIRVLAFDPGEHSTGWCLLESAITRGFARYLDGGNVESTKSAFRTLIATIEPTRTICAIEAPSGHIHEHVRGAALLATARVAGWIGGIAFSQEAKTIEVSASKWRLAICGKTNPSDAIVKLAVSRYTVGMPARSNAHVRDALGCGIVAMWNHLEAKASA